MTGRSLYFTAERTVEVRERPVPEPGAGEVRVSTIVSAISPGTEGLIYRGQVPTSLTVDETIDALSGSFDYPLRYGYAVVGEVTAVGEGVDDAWRGSTVFAFHPHESHFLAEPSSLHRVPEACPVEAAALVPNVETATNFVLDARPTFGERVAVFGSGVVGLLTTSILARFPLEHVLAVDPLAERRELAREFGADEAVTPAEARERFSAAGSRGRISEGSTGFDLTIEVSGNPDALDDAIVVTGYDGRIVVGSWYGTKRATLDLGGHFHRNRVRLQSSQVSTIDPERRGRWNADRRLDVAWRHLQTLAPERLITHRMPLEEADRAYRLLDERPERAVQILFTYGRN
ncbi:MAG: zinc-dependent alcohol dehydrogenase [Halobacteriota archaeon]